MGKKAKKSSGKTSAESVCGTCKNYRAKGKKKGRCLRKDKKRAYGEQACNHYDKA
jgi:hypothetical protein